MRPKNNYYFMTFVLLLASNILMLSRVHAAPKAEPGRDPISAKQNLSNRNKSENSSAGAWKDSLKVSPAPVESPTQITYKKKIEPNTSHQMGISYYHGRPDTDEESVSHSALSYRFNLHKTIDESHQLGLDLSSRYLILQYGLKFSCCQALPYAPYYKIGGVTWWAHSDFISNIVNFQRYYGMASFGFDDFFYNKRRVQFEINASLGISGTMLGSNFLYRF